jgi:folate-binding protein YgfZ
MVELDEAERLATEDVVAAATERDLLVVSGADAASYLHGQLSQTVEGLAVGQTSWTLLLQPQGKVDAWLRIHRAAADRFWLDLEAGFGQQAKERLERFKLRVDAEIELVTASMVALRGPGAIALAEQIVAAGQASPEHPANRLVALDASWAAAPGVDLVDTGGIPGQAAELDADRHAGVEHVLASLPPGIAVGPPEVLELIRIRQGRPAMGHELDESTIPAAAGVVDRSVDFTKGCYVGQELVARVDSRGNNTPTRLHSVRFAGPEPAPAGAELMLDGAAAGTITSTAVSPADGPIGLAYLKRSVELPAALTAMTEDGSVVAVEAVPLPDPAEGR